MILTRKGEFIDCGTRVFQIGMPVKATVGSIYSGLFGTVACVKTGNDRDNSRRNDVEVYVDFQHPHRPEVREMLQKRFGADTEKQYFILREWISVEPTQLIPSVCFQQIVRHKTSGRQYLVYLNGHCVEIATDITYRWPYAEFKELTEPVDIMKMDISSIVKKLGRMNDFLYHDLAYQLEDMMCSLLDADYSHQIA